MFLNEERFHKMCALQPLVIPRDLLINLKVVQLERDLELNLTNFIDCENYWVLALRLFQCLTKEADTLILDK